MSLFDSDDSLIDEKVFGTVSKNLSKDFKPWHKPRKQFIRDKQWLEQFKRLLRHKKYKNLDSVNYFGLPGGDLLDINYLYNGMINSSYCGNKKLGFHGFINCEVDYNKAQGELSKFLDKDRVESKSTVSRFRFEDLQKRNSEAWIRVKNFGVYHFINLDFCNSVMSRETLVSIYHLLDHQMKRVVGLPWVFCLTTRLNKDVKIKAIFNTFQEIINECLKIEQLNHKIEKFFNEVYNFLSANGSSPDMTTVNDKVLINQILQICLVLWILKEATKREFSVTLKSSMKYSVDPYNRDADMHSFVFSFEKEEVFIQDCLGLSDGDERDDSVEIEFGTLASPALEKLSQTPDIDSILENNRNTLNKYADEMIYWLNQCGYDTSIYREFMSTNYGYQFD